MEIVKRSDNMRGFVALPRRWVVERTFSWFGRNRRHAKDFENLAVTLATFVRLARAKAVTQQTTVGKCAMTKVGKSDGEGTLAGTRGNDKVAPIPDLRRDPLIRQDCADTRRSCDCENAGVLTLHPSTVAGLPLYITRYNALLSPASCRRRNGAAGR